MRSDTVERNGGKGEGRDVCDCQEDRRYTVEGKEASE